MRLPGPSASVTQRSVRSGGRRRRGSCILHEACRSARGEGLRSTPKMAGLVDIHVLTGSGRLVAHAGRIRAQVHAAATAAVEHLPLEGGDVDVDHEHFEWALERELFRTLAHELHHVARRRASALGHTLIDALVSDGLADHFSIEVTGMEPGPWAVALGPEQTAATSERARGDHDNFATTTAPGSSAAPTSRSRAGRGTRSASRSWATTSSAALRPAPLRSWRRHLRPFRPA